MVPESTHYTLQPSTASVMVTASVEYLPTYLYAASELVTSIATSDSPRPFPRMSWHSANSLVHQDGL